MQKAIGLIVLGTGLGLSVYMNAPSSSEREAQVAAITRIVARATILEPETVAAEQPGLRRPVSSPAFGAAMPAALSSPAVTAMPASPASDAATVVAAVTPVETPVEPPAAALDAKTERLLAREIQRELKRVGCYTGRLDGAWGEQSRAAMMAFISRVNASLPTTEPDVILLSLVKGHGGEVCGVSCPPSQVASGGRCVARAVIAAAEPQARPPVPAPVVAALADPEPRRPPPPGRMSIGGPKPETAETAAPVTGWPSPAGERLPWQNDMATGTVPAAPPVVAALAPDDPLADPSATTPRRPDAPVAGGVAPPPRKYVKPRSRQQAAKPNQKKRYANRSVQMLFLHPLGRM
jgi:hypothetical protein